MPSPSLSSFYCLNPFIHLNLQINNINNSLININFPSTSIHTYTYIYTPQSSFNPFLILSLSISSSFFPLCKSFLIINLYSPCLLLLCISLQFPRQNGTFHSVVVVDSVWYIN